MAVAVDSQSALSSTVEGFCCDSFVPSARSGGCPRDMLGEDQTRAYGERTPGHADIHQARQGGPTPEAPRGARTGGVPESLGCTDVTSDTAHGPALEICRSLMTKHGVVH
ncbi:hypothetical protein EYF80_004814 [Liparis tanakae]|uniref:Uncharacterized protein n=1 Tax=Liparis tanakae TaxID=230148 RepID=A0A4Z2J3G4_9TELE|nr:hypothetical protein EYF80_004814 [Liparis tanakae]